MEVLRSFDFETYRPKIMVVEIHADLLDQLQKTGGFRLLVDQGYDLVAWTAPSCIFLDTRLV